MPDRLTRIVTRGGDKGETSLASGARLAKDDARIHLLGEIDELNCWIGVALAHDPQAPLRTLLVGVQHDLFDLGGAVSSPGAPLLSKAHVARLDAAAEEWNRALAPLKDFVLPGGAPLIAWLHVARAVARRAERAAVALFKEPNEAGFAIAYLNRLSDLLFIAARMEAARLGAGETVWRKEFSIAPEGGAE